MSQHSDSLTIRCRQMVKIMVQLVQLKFPGSFVIWFLWMLWRCVSFVWACVFWTFIFDWHNLFHQLFSLNFDQWNFWNMDICYVQCPQFLRNQWFYLFEFWAALVELDFFTGLGMFLAVVFFLCCFPECQVCRFYCMFNVVGLAVLFCLGCS
jgi:hypothetical protein